MTEGELTVEEKPVFYLKNDRGTTFKTTNPDEVARLQRESSYKLISAEEGKAAFEGKKRAFESVDKLFGGQLTEVAKKS